MTIEARREHLEQDAIESRIADDDHERHDSHDERPDLDGCWLCTEAAAEAVAEHVWMGRAVRANPVNPYAPAPSWVEGSDGWVREPLLNRGAR